jgi:AraC family transcriptional regulator, arabinose operon regulatory protein
MHIRYELTPSTEQRLPLYIESVGHNDEQEKIVRDEGYPFYHWIQTFAGGGQITIEGKVHELPIGTGVLLLPHISHAYQATQSHWATQYLTFGGTMVQDILLLINLNKSAFYRWNTDTPLHLGIERILVRIKNDPDFSGFYASADLYQFMMTLKRYGQTSNKLPLSDTLLKLRPLLDWLDENFSNPEIGLIEMAQLLKITPRHMNTLFRHTFGHSPYAYLIALRIRKSKELLLQNPQFSINKITQAVGFRDTSHFVATFRQYVGFTPERFRELN